MKEIHKEIKKLFAAKNRRYEAVGFLEKNEPAVSSEEMFARTAGENGGAIGEEDGEFLNQNCDQFPTQLWRGWLVTNQRKPDNEEMVACFAYDGTKRKWRRFWHWLGYEWINTFLVVRRLP